MAKEYERTGTVSIKINSRHWWFFTLGLLGSIAMGGLVLLFALALGAANPPVVGQLQAQFTDFSHWPQTRLTTDLQRSTAPTDLMGQAFSLQAHASNTGPLDSAWGLWLANDTETLFILINNEGYLSVTQAADPAWQAFPHIRLGQLNEITLNVSGGEATLRINAEIAWSGNFSPAEHTRWGMLHYRQPGLNGQRALIFAG